MSHENESISMSLVPMPDEVILPKRVAVNKNYLYQVSGLVRVYFFGAFSNNQL